MATGGLAASQAGRELVQHAQRWFRSPRGKATRIILGSSSKVRRKLMDELCEEVGFKYDVLTADIDEKAIRREDPAELVTVLAQAKADAIRGKMAQGAGAAAAAAAAAAAEGQNANALLITCDQVVVHEGKILEKPEDEAEARRFIEGYARAHCSTVGGIAVTQLATGKVVREVDHADIHFTAIPDASIDALIAEGEIFWCAGGLMVEHDLVVPHVTRIDGTMDGVMGLPKMKVLKLLSTFFD